MGGKLTSVSCYMVMGLMMLSSWATSA